MTETPAPASEPDETTAAAPSTQVPDDKTAGADAPSAEVDETPADDSAATEDVETVTQDVEAPAKEAAPVAEEAAPDAATDTDAAAVSASEAEAEADTATAPVEADAKADADETDAGTTAAAVPAPTRPTPASVHPTPRPHPSPRPVPHPPTHPVAAAAGAPAAPAPTAPPLDAAEAATAATFGRVDDEGTVFVRESAGERVVGQFPGATSDEALALYVRRYLDLQAKVALFEARLTATDLSVKEIDQTLARLTDELAEPAAVGDLDGLRTRLDALRTTAAERRAVAEAERAAAREAAVVARTEIVEQAERVASTDPSRIQWRPAGEQLRGLLDQWKEAQRTGPRLDRPTEEALWKRFSHARTTFDRERRHFFAELETRNASAKAAKEALVVEAEKLQSSTDWGATAGAFRDLMTQWKAAGRASRADDDTLWARFRAAQDAFFAARDAQAAATDTEFRANLEVKESLLVEAEALVPVSDLAAAKQALRSIQDRWESAGKVPRGDIQRIEGRLRAVETAVRDADQNQWRRTNPETRARAEGAAAQLEQAIAGLEADLAKAEAAGDARRIADARAALDARRSWLEQVQRAAEEARG
ncbi:hypothetical protein Cch01nite_11290 [Cellulomonas chitinilytica]|uniref:DUF349 domain-containing protein n=1 Tax=Cellulomonas chitinilytica TaxID=398759 RepID=A0A919TYB2_9CELL|nr:DUF349 domain-containing protein [Cellulomonas chitinilytica]GIG20405.1 hypothetical protein Cch01nite_11290 [Cellulomonas chitinilytica]